MNSLRLAILVTFSTCWFADANHAVAAVAGPEYTYSFTAGPEQSTAYNGSTISIQDLNIVSWNLFGDPNGGLMTGDGSIVSNNGVSSYDQNNWTGSFTISKAIAPGAPSGTFGVNSFFGILSY